MNIAPVVLIVIAVLAVVIVAAYFSHLREKQRQDALGRFAKQLGWDYDADRDSRFDKKYAQFDAFQQGHTRFAHNLLRGTYAAPAEVLNEDGQPVSFKVAAGDYHYQITTSNGKSTQTHTYRFSYLIAAAPGAEGQDLTIRPEHFGDKMTAVLGFDDIDFESVEFSDQYHVKSRDKRFAYDVFHPRMMEFLMGDPSPKLQIAEGYLCITGKDRWEPHEFRQRLDWLARFFALWPRHLVS